MKRFVDLAENCTTHFPTPPASNAQWDLAQEKPKRFLGLPLWPIELAAQATTVVKLDICVP